MAGTLTRLWPDNSGDTVSVSFTGRGDGTITVTSDPCEGCDRSLPLSVEAEGAEGVTLTVSQTGRREAFGGADGDFLLSGGGTFNVLKSL